jgi:hypothetical protein
MHYLEAYSFAKQYKIKLDELWAVLHGEMLETGQRRAFEGPNLSSRVYVDTSARQALLAELAEEDRKEAERKAKRDLLDKRVVHSVPMAEFTDYQPQKAKK